MDSYIPNEGAVAASCTTLVVNTSIWGKLWKETLIIHYNLLFLSEDRCQAKLKRKATAGLDLSDFIVVREDHNHGPYRRNKALNCASIPTNSIKQEEKNQEKVGK